MKMFEGHIIVHGKILVPGQGVGNEALRNWKISVKALTKRLWKLMIKTK